MAGNLANVPNVAGVPALNFAPGFSQGLALLSSDAASYFSAQFGPQWGIFRGGAPVVVADSVIGIEYRKESSLSDYPLEQGAFETYDKVQLPYDARVRFSSGGSEANRAALLASIKAVADDYNLYDVVTPEATYTSVNIMHHDYRRTARNGLGLIQVDVWCLQVRITGSGTTSATQTPDASGLHNNGTVQPTDAPASGLGISGTALSDNGTVVP